LTNDNVSHQFTAFKGTCFESVLIRALSSLTSTEVRAFLCCLRQKYHQQQQQQHEPRKYNYLRNKTNSVFRFSAMSRGLTRSGRAYIQQNLSYYNSIQELKSHHTRLFNEELAVTTRLVTLTNRAVMSQTTARTQFNNLNNRHHVLSVFEDLFSQINQSADFHGFECVITFNAILSNKDLSTYSVFYGVDFREHNEAGTAPELRYPCKYIFNLFI